MPSLRRAVSFLVASDALFAAGVVIALVWANVDTGSYDAFALRLRFLVNELLMVLFFGIAAKEVREALLPGGPLASWKLAAMPLVATAGGMAGPAVLYLAGASFLDRPDLVRGWAIPTATDIAFCAIVARFVFGERHPAVPFLLLLAIADDAGGLVILATAYPQGVFRPLWLFGLLALAIGVGLALNRGKVTNPWPYVALAGAPAWFALHEGGLHPALALVPIMWTLPHAKTDQGVFADETAELPHAPDDALHRFKVAFATPVSLILGLFGLVNAGVPLGGAGAATLLVGAGLVLGKPLGICVAVALGRLCGLTLPEGMRMREMLVLGVTAGIGFTVALFVSTVALDVPRDLVAAKMGALASIAAAPLALLLGRIMRVARMP